VSQTNENDRVDDERLAFEQLTSAQRNAIKVHCYRMLGSLADAEDATQETFARAWRGRKELRSKAAARSWLFRIATNACLDALRQRKRERRLWSNSSPADGNADIGSPDLDVDWLEPMPDAMMTGIESSPHAAYEQGEAVRLAFLACVQLLPPRQRAVFLLQEVLGWSAAEVATAFETSPQAANSLLQRARRAFDAAYLQEPKWFSATQRDQQIAESYAAAFEQRDVDAFVALLRSDATLRMPPWRAWLRGRDAIRPFVARTWSDDRTYRARVFEANGRAAIAVHVSAGGNVWRTHSVHVIETIDEKISSIVAFVELDHRDLV
jgi:RNA polymerase sigma-70 factor (ECF subfamily)